MSATFDALVRLDRGDGDERDVRLVLSADPERLRAAVRGWSRPGHIAEVLEASAAPDTLDTYLSHAPVWAVAVVMVLAGPDGELAAIRSIRRSRRTRAAHTQEGTVPGRDHSDRR